MDVVCGRCRAEYDFDDTLISEKGTTVRCTSCGYQFKVFPQAGRTVPEVWTLTPQESGKASVTYESLRDLQRAILRGDVDEHDLLARGDQPPRPLHTILELAPLLSQPRSLPPPGRSSTQAPAQEASGQSGTPRRAGQAPQVTGVAGEKPKRAPTGTVIGLAAPRVPRFHAATPPAPDLSSPPPVESRQPREDGAPGEAAETSSAATAHSSSAEEAGEPAAMSGGIGSTAAAPAATSATEGAAREGAAPTPSNVGSQVEAEPSSSAQGPGEKSPPQPPIEEPAQVAVPPPSVVRDTPPSRETSTVRNTSAVRQTRPSREMTPISRAPITERGRGARGVWLVLVVVLGAGAFLFYAIRDRLPLGKQEVAVSEQPSEASPSPAALRAAEAAIDLADEAWLRVRLVPESERAAAEAALEARLLAAERQLEELDEVAKGEDTQKSLSWFRVHLLRMKGQLSQARAALARNAGKGPDDAYGLAMLDLADESAERPDAVILSQLKEAAAGQRGRFQARSAYIYALAVAGRVEDARAELAALAQLEGGKDAPLFNELDDYLSRMAEEGDKANEKATQ